MAPEIPNLGGDVGVSALLPSILCRHHQPYGRFQICFYIAYYFYPVTKLTVSLSILGLIVYLGMMVGAVVLGGLADKLGRKKCLMISLAINAAFAFLSSFVQGYGFFLFCRLISGLGWVTGESFPCPGGVLSQLSSLGVWGGRRKSAPGMHLWYRARTALLFSTCGCITSLLTLKVLAVRKFGH